MDKTKQKQYLYIYTITKPLRFGHLSCIADKGNFQVAIL